LTSQIASQKELIRTAIQNVKAMSSKAQITSDQHLDFEKCPEDQIESYHLRKVLEVLGQSVNLKQSEEILLQFA
jgi:hypothetical protein